MIIFIVCSLASAKLSPSFMLSLISLAFFHSTARGTIVKMRLIKSFWLETQFLFLSMPAFWFFFKHVVDSLPEIALIESATEADEYFNLFFVFFFTLYLLLIVSNFLLGDFLALKGTYSCMLSGIFLFWLYLVVCSSFFFFDGGLSSACLSSWIRPLDFAGINLAVRLDLLSFGFVFLTASIAFFTNIFAFAYFRHEPNVERLILLLNAFVLSMCLLVIADNLVVLFLGWELIGLTSFLLINFWQTRVGTLKAAFKAYSFNKLSDASLLFGMVLVYSSLGELDLSAINNAAYLGKDLCAEHFFKVQSLDLVCVGFLTAAFIKSAQLGFHIWLPDSMEAPVPASALIHSATLVSAGIYLVSRFQPVFDLTVVASSAIPIFGSLTALLGGFSALYQADLKRVLAYSTISHCGFLFVLAALGPTEWLLVYLYSHGFFKASSFLCAGNVIRFSKNYQDVRRMGCFWKYLPAEASFLLFFLANLGGLPSFVGYGVKHFVLATSKPGLVGSALAGVCMLAAVCGLFYAHKVFYFVFFDSKKARKSVYLGSFGRLNSSSYFSNTTLASSWCILMLALVAYYFVFSLDYHLGSFSAYSLSDSSRLVGDCASYALTGSLIEFFNSKLVNTSIALIFFFINSLSWSKSVSINISWLASAVFFFLML